VSLDFPRGEAQKAKVPNPSRNDELQKKYSIRGFPTVLLMTAEGEVYAQTGYKGMSPEEYLADVRDLRGKGKKALEDAKALAAEYEKAKEKEPVVRKAIAALNAAGEGVPAGEKLAEIVRHGLTLDPENKSGLKLESLKALVLAAHAAPGERALALEMDPKNELGLLEAVVHAEFQSIDSDESKATFLAHAKTLFDAGKVHKAERVAMVFAVAAYFLNQDGDAEAAKPYAKKALDLGGLEPNIVELMKGIVGETPEQ
jgi:hypothetical protein